VLLRRLLYQVKHIVTFKFVFLQLPAGLAVKGNYDTVGWATIAIKLYESFSQYDYLAHYLNMLNSNI